MRKIWKRKMEVNSSSEYIEEDDTSNKVDEKQINHYPSATVILDIILNEYKNEIDRGRSFDTRSGIFLPVIGAIIIFLPDLMNKMKWNKEINVISDVIPEVLVLSLVIISIALLLISSTNFIAVLKSKEYERINYKNLNKNIAVYPEDSIRIKLIEEYVKILNKNIETNNEKAKYYKIAMGKVQQALFVISAVLVIGTFIK